MLNIDYLTKIYWLYKKIDQWPALVLVSRQKITFLRLPEKSLKFTLPLPMTNLED